MRAKSGDFGPCKVWPKIEVTIIFVGSLDQIQGAICAENGNFIASRS